MMTSIDSQKRTDALLALNDNVLVTLYKKLFRKRPAPVQTPEPEPITPDTIALHEKIARDTFKDIDDEYYLKVIMDESRYGNLDEMPSFGQAMINDNCKHLPETLDAPFEHIDNKYAARVSYTIWVLYYGPYDVQVAIPTPTTIKTLSYDKPIIFKNKPDKMPKGVLRATKVTIGTTLVDGTLRGCRWVHYLEPG